MKNKQKLSTPKGFTLIELLIVVVIIGTLSALLMANFIGVRQRARDGQRKADLRQTQSALELYRADSAAYSIVSGKQLNATNCPTSSGLISGSTTYMQKIPCDPLGTGTFNGGNYYYSSNGTTYTVAACLENTGDPQGTSTSPDATVSGCASSFYYVLQNP